MATLLAVVAVLLGSSSIWYAAYWIRSVDDVSPKSRHFYAAVWAAVAAGLLTWLVAPAEAGAAPGWGWVTLAMVIAIALFAFARQTPQAADDVLQRHSPSRATRTGWQLCRIAFDYQDADGERTARQVTVHSVTKTYLKGECHLRRAERTFRLDRVRGDITDMDTGEILPVKKWAKGYR